MAHRAVLGKRAPPRPAAKARLEPLRADPSAPKQATEKSLNTRALWKRRASAQRITPLLLSSPTDFSSRGICFCSPYASFSPAFEPCRSSHPSARPRVRSYLDNADPRLPSVPCWGRGRAKGKLFPSLCKCLHIRRCRAAVRGDQPKHVMELRCAADGTQRALLSGTAFRFQENLRAPATFFSWGVCCA
jgi:hypothetical protein